LRDQIEHAARKYAKEDGITQSAQPVLCALIVPEAVSLAPPAHIRPHRSRDYRIAEVATSTDNAAIATPRQVSLVTGARGSDNTAGYSARL